MSAQSYELFAPFYDEVMGDRARDAEVVHSLIERHNPGARSILELACGTGAMLEQLRHDYDVAGLDISKPMLRVARKKLPGTRLVHADMTRFTLGETFDVVLCLFDSINHLRRFSQWKAVFAGAHRHLTERGIFIFDVNTPRKLASLADQPPFMQWFGDGNLLVIDVSAPVRGVYTWKIRVFDHRRGSTYQLHAEDIPEVAFPVERIRTAFARRFRGVRVYDPERRRPTAQSLRLFFVGRR